MSRASTVEASGPARRIWPWLAAGLAALTVGLLLRYGLFQSRTAGRICLEQGRPFWCEIRDQLALVHEYGIWGWLGFGAAAGGFWTGRRWALAIGLVASIFALVVYNTVPGALGLIVTLLRLARD